MSSTRSGEEACGQPTLRPGGKLLLPPGSFIGVFFFFLVRFFSSCREQTRWDEWEGFEGGVEADGFFLQDRPAGAIATGGEAGVVLGMEGGQGLAGNQRCPAPKIEDSLPSLLSLAGTK